MMTHMRTFLGSLLALGLMALVPAPAHAERSLFNDTQADVWAHRGGAPTIDAAHTDGDVRTVTLNHRRHTVRMLMTVDTIDADGGSSYRPALFRFTLVNGRGLEKVFVLDQDDRLRVRKPSHGRFVAAGCRWIRHSVDLRTREARVVIPRSCLGRPRVLRLEATAFDWDRSGVTYVDDAYSAYDTTGTRHGTSPWVKRG